MLSIFPECTYGLGRLVSTAVELWQRNVGNIAGIHNQTQLMFLYNKTFYNCTKNTVFNGFMTENHTETIEGKHPVTFCPSQVCHYEAMTEASSWAGTTWSKWLWGKTTRNVWLGATASMSIQTRLNARKVCLRYWCQQKRFMGRKRQNSITQNSNDG